LKRPLLEEILEDRRNKVPVALVTQLNGGAQWLVRGEGTWPAGLPEEITREARDILEVDRCQRLQSGGRDFFVQSFNPPLRLIIVGAVHIAQFLASMAELVGFEVIVIEPREAFARSDRFTGFEVRREWPGPAFAELKLDARSAVVSLSHDPKIDDPALAAALASPAFYIGALGSRKNHRGRLERLAALGFDESDRNRVHGPVGLAIGSRSAAEIAVSIVAQVIETRRGLGR